MNTISFDAIRISKTEAVMRLVIDGKDIESPYLDPFSILFEAGAASSEFYPMSCTCGEPGCAGFFMPLYHLRDGTRVIWRIADDKLASILEGRQFIFGAEAFDAARQILRETIEALERDNVFLPLMTEYDIDENGAAILRPIRLADAEAFHGKGDTQ